MPPRPRKIARHEWEPHRETIRDLYAQHTLSEVIERLREEYGFSASPSQYEAQLKLWGFRKNLTRSEWETHLANSDGQLSMRFTTSSGRLKDKKQIQRGKRYIEQTQKAEAAQITIPSQLPDSTASAHALDRPVSCPSIQLQQHLTLQPSSVPLFDNGLMIMGGSLVRQNANFAPGTQDSLTSNLPKSLESGSNESFHKMTTGLPSNSMTTFQRPASPTFELSSDNTEYPQLFTFQLQTENWSPFPGESRDQHLFDADDCNFGSPQRLASNTPTSYRQETSIETGVALHSVSVIQSGRKRIVRDQLFGLHNEWLQTLPSAKFEAWLSGQGMALTWKSNSAFKPSLSGSLTLMSFANIFPKSSGTIAGQFKDVMAAFRRLSNLIPSTTGAVISEQQMTNLKIIKMIFFSMINGFAGMDGIPIESLLSCLRRLEVSKPSFEQLLLGPPSPAKRSFIDNLFKAAIVAKDEEMVKMILKHNLVDVDNIICLDGGRRYTPVEKAASLQALGIIRILVEYGADVTKSYEDLRDSFLSGCLSWSGALEHLLQSYDSKTSPPSLELVDIVRFLIAKGSNVRIELLNTLADRVGIDEVGSLLSHAVPPADHRAFFDKPAFRRVPTGVVQAAGLEHDGVSNSIIRHMVGICQSNGGSCLSKFADVIEDAAVEAAIRGRVETVKLLIGFAASTDRILSAAIRSRDPDLIRFLSDRSIDFNPPAGSCLVPKGDHPTTPFAEAIRTGDSEMIAFLESIGCGTLSSLTDHGRLEAAIMGAVKGANMFYFRRLLSIASHSKVKFRIPSSVVRLAVDRGHEEVTQLLVEQGAELGGQVLVAALEQRNQSLVAVVLATDLSDRIYGEDQNLTKALLKWAEPSVLQSILYTMPDIDIPRDSIDSPLADFCSHCMDTDNFDLFRFFIESTSCPDKDLNRCLTMAVRVGHRQMASYLLKKGANPSDSRVLAAAIHDRPEMLFWLFGSTPLDEEQAHPLRKCLGANILWSLVTEDTKSVEVSVLDELLKIGAVNFIVPEEVTLDFRVTPLGLAILGTPPFRSSNLSAVDKLLEAGADPNGLAKLEKGPYRCITALMAAVDTGREDMVTLLIDQKADVNFKPRLSLRRTPLQYAAELGNLDIIRLLLQKGADIDSPPAYQGGGTALQFASISGNCNIVAELLEHGASLDMPPSKIDGRWPLEGAAEHGRLDMIQLLWNARELSPGNVGFEKRQCLRAMDFARENGHFGCRDLISELSGLSVELLDTEDYGVPWLTY